jgi:hypothetical protein
VHERQEQTLIQCQLWHSRLWLWWILASAASGAVVGALEEGGFQFFATLVLTGPLIGVAQWLVMRRYIRAAGWWVVASTLGWWIGINLRFLLVGILNPLIQSLWQEFGLWEVFWINTVRSLYLGWLRGFPVADAPPSLTACKAGGYWLVLWAVL